MKSFTNRLRQLASKEDGATMVEYGLMVAVIAVVVVVGATVLGTNVNTLFNTVSTSFSN